jgi:predicted small integral membrane protein
MIDLSIAKALYAAGWGFWLLLASLNNLMDANTNRTLLHRMISMQEIKNDPMLGHGLLGRAIDKPSLCRLILYMVVLPHLCVAGLLLRAAWLYLSGSPEALGAATLAWASFGGVWFAFLTGGLYFGYWLKMPAVQQVHLTLLMMAVLGLLLSHMPVVVK